MNHYGPTNVIVLGQCFLRWEILQMQSTSAALFPVIQIRLPGKLYTAIESFRRNEPDIPTRPEAVRRLIQRALEARAQTLLAATESRS
jgi:hypothetical protein